MEMVLRTYLSEQSLYTEKLMNNDKLNLIIDDYLDKFDITHDDRNDEFMKWRAAAVCQKSWNIDAPDFGAMFKRAMSETGVFIDTNTTQPTQGIYHICADHDQNEQVRASFKKLLSEDGRETQAHMDEFIDEVNEIIAKFYPKSWKYPQDRKTVSDYVGMLRPDQDYFYKSSLVSNFTRYVEYGGDIGIGRTFKLKNYYKMCDEVISGINERDDLIDKVSTSLKAYAEKRKNPRIVTVDPAYHILVFDIIYCSNVYGFFKTHPVSTVRKDPNAEKRAELEKEILVNEEPLAALYSERDSLNFPDMVGKHIKHITYGEGIITDQKEDSITVDFAGTIRKMKASVLYSKKLITGADSSADDILRIVDLDRQISQLEIRLTALKGRLENL